MTVTVEIQANVAIVTIDNPPVNAASHDVRKGIIQAIAQTESDDNIKAVVLICTGRTFVAGADVREFNKPPLPPFLPDVTNAIEATTKPWIAAIHGTALGGGFELALACDYRIADAGAKFGLPEVTLGLIPGAGGTVRLPRLVGPVFALDMIAGGKPISADVALSKGLLDHIATKDLRDEAIAFATDKGSVELPARVSTRSVAAYDHEALAAAISKIKVKARGQNSPLAAINAVNDAITLPPAEAFIAERDAFLKLKEDPQSKALRHIFFAERAAGKIPSIAGLPMPVLETVGVVGGGTMGAGIAAACLLAGLKVTMIERDDAALSAGKSRVSRILESSLKRGVLSPQKHSQTEAAFHASIDYRALNDADLVIEAVFESMDVKHAVFAQLDAVTKPTAVLASNTSYLDIRQIAQAVKNPDRVIGLHFFSPAHIMKLLELVVPETAAPSAIAVGAALGKRLRKITVPSGVCDGFIGNRIMSAYRQSCEYMLEDGALPSQIDAAMRDFGFPMGIYEMQDLAGNDISWAMRKRLAPTRDPAERYVDIADKLCELGRFGQKTGLGWYRYEGKERLIDPLVEDLIKAESARKGITRRTFGHDEIIDTILSAMRSTGAKILEEGIASKASDIDVVMVNGYGFPRWRGGPMYDALPLRAG